MPKQKSKKAIVKRFRKTASGRIKSSGAGRGHLFTNKSRKQKRRRRAGGYVSAVEQKRLSVLMP
jgi:large subunit ribosomal protein L35